MLHYFIRTYYYFYILCFRQPFPPVRNVLFHTIFTVLFFVYVSILYSVFYITQFRFFIKKSLIFILSKNLIHIPISGKIYAFSCFFTYLFIFFRSIFYLHIITLFFTLHHYHLHFTLLHYSQSCFFVQIANVHFHHQKVSQYIVTHVIMITAIHLCHHHHLHQK